MLFGFVPQEELLTTFMAQLVGALASDAFSGLFTPRQGHFHIKGFNYKMIYWWYKTSQLLSKRSNSSLIFSKSKGSL